MEFKESYRKEILYTQVFLLFPLLLKKKKSHEEKI